MLDQLTQVYPKLRVKLINKAYSELTDEELGVLKNETPNNPLVTLGVCSKYKMGKILANIKAAVGIKRWTMVPKIKL